MPQVMFDGTPVTFTGEYTGGYDCINQGRFYETPFLEHIRSLDLRGTYLDIGTNIGNHLLFFAMFCPSDRVIGFEPMPHWRARAVSNIEANGIQDKVRLIPYGLSDRAEEISFNPYGTEHWLECATMDSFLGDVSGVAFVKMDIEGSEPKALLGGREFFKRNRPVIAAEVLGSTDALISAAEAIGYRLTGNIFPSTPGSPMYELLPT